MKNFALIGASGFIAPRHMKAIKDTNNNLHSALDKFDSIGIIDSYFPSADFFTEFERFDRHINKLERKGVSTDYVSVCSPNYLHDAHIRFGLRIGADVICEKPLVLNPWNVDGLEQIENETGRKVYNILQLRLHPAIKALKSKIDASTDEKKYDVRLTYITSRGNWYQSSWKGDIIKSGGIATNIGVHFFDMLNWIFGPFISSVVHCHDHKKAAGLLEFKKARVQWFLSIDYNDLPESIKLSGLRTFRSMKIGDEDVEFSDGFTELHTESYKQILNNQGFRLSEARTAVEIVHNIRTTIPVGLSSDYHPYCKEPSL